MLQQDGPVKSSGSLTEQEKLTLVMEVADQIGRRYGVDPCELWGAGWEAVKVAEAGWKGRGPLPHYMRVCIRGQMLDSLKKRKADLISLPL